MQNMQNGSKTNGGKESVGKKSVHLYIYKKKKRLAQLCVFGYKVGRTISFTAFYTQPNPQIIFSFDKVQKKSKLIVFFIETSHHILTTGVLLYKPSLLLILYTLQNIHSNLDFT